MTKFLVGSSVKT